VKKNPGHTQQNVWKGIIKLLVRCVKNPLEKATGGRDIKKGK
jgi:hypothetical protein